MMEVSASLALREVEQTSDTYEKALARNDLMKLDDSFRNDKAALRYGAAEIQVGYDASQVLCAQGSAANLSRAITSRHIPTFRADFAGDSITFTKTEEIRTGRKIQAWARFPNEWHVVWPLFNDGRCGVDITLKATRIQQFLLSGASYQLIST